MTRRKKLLASLLAAAVAPLATAAGPAPVITIDTSKEPIAKGKFDPTWESLSHNEVPEWYRDAKFGIWAHWGPQCQPEHGDWYARNMYVEKNGDFKSHVKEYGPQDKFGFKDVIHTWKAEKWDPNALLDLYKRAGAQYFFALANHHDNMDLWDSKYQPWNSVAVGPQKDLIGGWAKAARDHGMKFGVSVHASHAWTWYEPSQAFDGNLTLADGKGLWWEGLDPQALYAQRHPLSKTQNVVWDWNADKGCSIPDQAYCDKFYNRTADLINKYHPDLLYFDDTVLPLYPITDAGLKIAAHFYNSNMALHDGQQQGVLFGKGLAPDQRHAVTWDIERGASNKIEPLPWQTDTCIGAWHYDRSIYDRKRYKSTATVIHTLADIVSKNGNLCLNIPLRGDGSIDDEELEVVEGIAKWMDVNKESIFGTRPFKVFGDGPASLAAATQSAGNFNEGKGHPLTPDDVRFTTKGDVLYVITMGIPTKPLSLATLGKSVGNLDKSIAGVSLLGSDEKIAWSQSDAVLMLPAPKTPPSDHTVVYKLTLK